jgi:DNA-binding LacI/PurR family transcriptional regulator
MTGRVSIRDVAREAGVSVTTVSHALNGKGRLNAETRKRVREVADRLGYRPNPAARSLVSGHTGLIAAIPSLPREFRAEFTEFGFFSELITAATGVAVGRDQALVVSPPGADWFIWDRVPLDGVIVIEPVVGEAALPDLRRRGIPFVTISTDPADGRDDAIVRSDDREGAQRVLDHLAKAGADRVAMLAPPPLNAFTRDCAETYRRWCTLRDRSPRLEVVAMTDLARGPEEAYLAALDRLLDRRPAPDALFVPIELAGVMVLEELASRGIRVPDDVLLATTHDIGRGVTTVPPMTTLEWNYAELGRRAAEMLLDLIDGTRSAPCEEVVPTTLMPRASTAR